MPPGSRRPLVAASHPSCLPCRHVAAFKTDEPARHHMTRPRAPFKRPAVTRKTTSEALHEDRPSVASALGRESASLDTRPLTEVNTPPRDTEPPPPSPQRTAATIPLPGFVGSSPLCQKVWKSALAFWPPEGMLRISPQSFQMRCCRLRQRAEQLNACPILLAPQQRGDGHSRTSRASPCGVLGITVNQPKRMPLHVPLVPDALAGQTDAAQTVPLRNSPAYRPPKGMPAPRRGCRPRSCGGIRASLRASRITAACLLRQLGRRSCGPVTLPQSGCPVCRSRNPAV